MKIIHSLISIILIFLIGCTSGDTIREEQKTAPGKNDNSAFIAGVNLDTVKAGEFDTGTMWAFEYFPKQYFKETYDFEPDEKWLNSVRLSSLKFATYCSASFVSEDGLILTNNHCARESVADVSEEGEDLNESGFVAANLNDERMVDGLFVDQVVDIKDITDEIQTRIKNGEDEFEIINDIELKESEKSGLLAVAVSLYNGGKYSLYYYKRFSNIKLVFSPEQAIGHFGGEYDNFTYPRYNLDAALFRAYDDSGKPLKINHYLEWDNEGADEGEAVFVVGNPAVTNRLETVSKLTYYRDVVYPRTIDTYSELIEAYKELIEREDANEQQLRVQMMRFENGLKAYKGMLKGLRDPVVLQKKISFEKNFKSAVESDPELNNLYGNLWDEDAQIQKEQKEISNQLFALTLNPLRSSQYFFIAANLVEYAEQLKRPEGERDEYYTEDNLDQTILEIVPDEIDYEQEKKLLRIQIKQMINYLGRENKIVKELAGNKTPDEASEDILNRSKIKTPDDIKSLLNKGSNAILNSDDPFIYFVLNTSKVREELQQKTNILSEQEDEISIKLGNALYKVYGTDIPPDATFTLRISDGVVKSYPYNGTIAPPFTTFYGLYDRYYSFKGNESWELHERWLNPPQEFDLSAKFNFVSTNDITGGNSGSPVIDKDGKIVGLAFDGNIESLKGSFLFDEETNRTVSVHTKAITESLKYIYKAEKLADEVIKGKRN